MEEEENTSHQCQSRRQEPTDIIDRPYRKRSLHGLLAITIGAYPFLVMRQILTI